MFKCFSLKAIESLTKPTMSIPCILILMSLFYVSIGSQAYPNSLPGCPDKCGNLSIPYPFGTKPGCFHSDHQFYISCNTSYNPPKAFWGDTPINVTEIMLSDGEMRAWGYIARLCYDKSEKQTASNINLFYSLGRFPFSYSKSKLTVVGCDAFALFQGGAAFTTGCLSECSSLNDVINDTCSGIGCCQTSIPKMAFDTKINLSSFSNNTKVSNFDACSYAFVVEEAAYKFTSLDFHGLQTVSQLPVILDWTISNQTCLEAKKNLTSYECKENSNCTDSDNGPGYRCNCKPGYEGNPYLLNCFHRLKRRMDGFLLPSLIALE